MELLGQLALERGVRLPSIFVATKHVSDPEVSVPLPIVTPENVEVSDPATGLILGDEQQSAAVSHVAAEDITPALERHDDGPLLRSRAKTDGHVHDRLGYQAGDGGRADVFDPAGVVSESAAQDLGVVVEDLRPARVVVAQGDAAPLQPEPARRG